MIDNSIVDQKVQKLQEIFSKIDPNTKLDVEDNGDGGKLVYGPFPSFIILVQAIGPMRALVHVNADAPNLLFIFKQFFAELDIEYDGPFAVEGESGQLIMGPDSYKKKEDNILMFAQDILNRRAQEKNHIITNDGIVIPTEKKIVIAQ